MAKLREATAGVAIGKAVADVANDLGVAQHARLGQAAGPQLGRLARAPIATRAAWKR